MELGFCTATDSSGCMIEVEYGTVSLNEEMHLYIILGIVNSTADEQCANKSSELYIFRHF